MLLAVSWIGTLPAWLTVTVIVIAAVVVYRGGGGTALDTLQTANRVLETRVHDLEKQGKEDARTIAQLEAKTDFAVQLAPMMKWAETHERNAEARQVAMLAILELVASRLGTETAG